MHAGDEAAPPLSGALDVDVAVVGGGYTGLWTALALREREPSLAVALFEGRRVGEGPSGRNGGFLHGYWSTLATLRDVLGDGAALQLAHASSAIVPAVRDFCEARGEDVWLHEGGLLRVSAGPTEDAGVERALAATRALGVEEEAIALDGAALRRHCDSPRFRRAALFRDGATVQPARLALALRRAALDAGVLFFELTPVTAIGAGTLETPSGSVRAPEIVLAVNAWGTSWPLGGRQTNFGSAIVLTEPAPELLAETGWTGGEAIVDGRMFLHYFRTTRDGRVLMGSGSGRLGFGDRVGSGLLNDRPAQARARRRPARVAARLRRDPRRGLLERADRRLGRQAAPLRNRPRYEDPLRRRLLRERRRPELARRPDPRLPRPRSAGRVDGASARRPARSAVAARAVSLRRRQGRALGDARDRAGDRGRPEAESGRPRRCGYPPPAADADRSQVSQRLRSGRWRGRS